MPPNARMPAVLFEEPPEHEEPVFEDVLTSLLDKQADTAGLTNVDADNEDWTDVKHSERKKRDRILDDGVLIGLMKKSDAKGFQRLFLNLSIMAATVYTIHQMEVLAAVSSTTTEEEKHLSLPKLLMFLPLYFFYGFQFQCFAFAGQHEFLHRNAWKTKWINDWALFFVGVFCFELGEHERVMHKQHHTFTNHIDKDPELTSFYSRETLENPGFRNVPSSRYAYLMGFLDIFTTFKCRAGRILCSAMGIAVDYSGTGWSLQEFNYSKESGIMAKLQRTALMQLTFYLTVACTICQTRSGLEAVLFWWIVPVLIGYPVVNYFRNLEHANCEVSKISNCLRNTRSVRSNLFIRILLWDTNFHAEHHLYPMVPFYNLHKLNKLMKEHVINSEKDHFTTQNIAAFVPGGWIDTQARDMAAHEKAKAE